jgi:hypothetical protein
LNGGRSLGHSRDFVRNTAAFPGIRGARAAQPASTEVPSVNPKSLPSVVPPWCAARIAALSLAAVGLSAPAGAQYAQIDPVSNVPGLATITDPMLLN